MHQIIHAACSEGAWIILLSIGTLGGLFRIPKDRMTSIKVICLTASAAFLTLSTSLQAMDYEIRIDPTEKQIERGHLDLGGETPSGDRLDVNSYYLEWNSEPIVPVFGELHFARYPQEKWDESIRKMKAGGITVVSSYVFWNLHEAQQGTFDWSGNLDLRRFVETCAANDMKVVVRLGPFCHGEMRNGGLPDWLYGQPFEIRSNDEGYLELVDRLYGEIAQQLEGLLFKDGGPIIGVQLENEFQHSAAPWEITYAGAAREYTVADRDVDVTHAGVSVSGVVNENAEYGMDHMSTLKLIAKKHGMEVPLYTATGWGNAAIVQKGSLPVTAGYAYPFWSKPKPSPFYLYKDIHAEPDYSPVSFEATRYPSIPAELGPGIVATWKRRPMVDPDSVAPMIVRILGSGSNGIGYYMYHGGSTPVVDGLFMSEESNGVPKINYDFQAPIGEYGQIRSHHRSLNEIHLFLESFGSRLAPMKTTLPETNADIRPDNTDTLRYATRTHGESGFVFLHNFQDHLDTQTIEDVSITVAFEDSNLRIPEAGSFDVPSECYAILPLNFDCGDIRIKSATVQPLSELAVEDGKSLFVFSSRNSLPAEIVFEGIQKVESDDDLAVDTVDGVTKIALPDESISSFSIESVRFVIIPQSMSCQAWQGEGDVLYFSEATLLPSKGQMELLQRGEKRAIVHVLSADSGFVLNSETALAREIAPIHRSFKSYEFELTGDSPELQVEAISERKLALSLKGDLRDVNDVILSVPYVGDRGLAFIDGELLADHFYLGRPWEISLKRFQEKLEGDQMVLVFHPMLEDYEYMVDLEYSGLKPEFDESGKHLEIGKLSIQCEWKAHFSMEFR
ncbi:beta-galactosidase [Pelagicoccus albus]|uniref:Beta-galactosidase n=1 Tax=Pelagicoccus albus TaxID=415222 RepID=A0A7X1E8X9_9BACT|nr:beta-galactosidase [Pelagicoccus albus]MBC2606603.1 beta-galactosidase [Pelagicoccus albus]